MNQISAGVIVKPRELLTIHSERIRVPDRQQLVHLQFRRFAGCPVCNLHLHSIVQQHNAIMAASIREVVVFHTSVEELFHHAADLPFAVIADPDKRLYADFRVESEARALLDPRVWIPILRGLFRSMRAIFRGEPIPPLNPQGARFGLPADFLIANDGRVLACKYGSHAYDQWSVDEILALSSLKDTASYPQSRMHTTN
jgi:peroxiredoxin